MDDSSLGARNKRGDWSPHARIVYPPLFVWPPRPLPLLKWLVSAPGYLFPWTIFYFVVALLSCFYLTPPAETARSLAPGWIGLLLLRNLGYVLVFYGGMHLLLYVKRAQGTQFKFHGRWPESSTQVFLFKDQVFDNMFWTLLSGVPIWTAFEVLLLWMYANGHLMQVSWAQHPLYNLTWLLLIPIWREFHFYVVHRALHIPVLYRWFHKLHHNNVSTVPWSGLAMHPVEHLLYFSTVLIVLLVPSSPLHTIFILVHAGLTPAQGHVGFSRMRLLGCNIDFNTYAHYLHHKFFECNYADGAIPLDQWFGTFHDGSKQAQEAMDQRFLARTQRAGAKHI